MALVLTSSPHSHMWSRSCVLAHHPVGALQQELEQHELPRREVERFAADLGDAADPVEGESAELDERRLAGGCRVA